MIHKNHIFIQMSKTVDWEREREKTIDAFCLRRRIFVGVRKSFSLALTLQENPCSLTLTQGTENSHWILSARTSGLHIRAEWWQVEDSEHAHTIWSPQEHLDWCTNMLAPWWIPSEVQYLKNSEFLHFLCQAWYILSSIPKCSKMKTF